MPDWIIRIGIRVLLAYVLAVRSSRRLLIRTVLRPRPVRSHCSLCRRTLQGLDLGSEEKNVAAKMAYVDGTWWWRGRGTRPRILRCVTSSSAGTHATQRVQT
ncbi:MAG: hypothetical protein EOO41_04530 [Methanobacteriota archaeon]|nr:MAG: hypothetical protein EOO41_04530 [Euryarchaeota archaeon]